MPRTVYEYKRIETSVDNQRILREQGYTPVFSSNVSAIQRKLKDLYIRFHNGAVYKYPNQGSNFNSLLTSPSKGKWVWANLRRKNVAYSKVGSMPLDGDIDFTTEELFAMVAKQGLLVQALAMVEAISPTITPITLINSINSDLTAGLIVQSVAKL